jgi:iron complex transport system ATP-binding protein
MHALRIDNVSFGYRRGIPTLRNVSFSVHQGEFLTLVGPNGSGKTTLLKLLDRLLLPDEGTIFLGEKPLAHFSRAELARQIAFIPQDTGILFPFTVAEVVLMGRAPHTYGAMFENEHDRQIAVDMMRLTDILHLAQQPITAISGGERQRVFLARALAQQAGILLMDEPNAHLDIAHQLEAFSLIRKLNQEQNLTVVCVSHDLNLAATYSDRVGILVCGSLTALGTPHEVLTESTIRAAFQTQVLVDRHPAKDAPRISLLPLS